MLDILVLDLNELTGFFEDVFKSVPIFLPELSSKNNPLHKSNLKGLENNHLLLMLRKSLITLYNREINPEWIVTV